MIYHIIRGHVLHTSPLLVKEIITLSGKVSPETADQHYFCVIMFDGKMLYDNIEEDPYTRIFEEKKVDKYKLFYSKWNFLKFLLNFSVKDKVLIHGNAAIAFQFLSYLSVLFLRKGLLRRMSLICWGNNDYVKGEKLKTKLSLGLLRSIVYSHFKYIITLSEEDRKTVSELYPKANVVYLPYMNDNIYTLHRENNNKSDKLLVMVSHSGWPENNHIKSFKLLAAHKEHIKVVCPLCYGDAAYIESVIQKGQAVFGEYFSYFKDLKPIDEYMSFLQTVNIFVTSAERQTGLGAIFRVMTGGAKVYLTGNLLESLRIDGYKVFDISTIETEEFEVFSTPLTDEDARKNVERYNYTHCNGEPVIQGWKRVYEY